VSKIIFIEKAKIQRLPKFGREDSTNLE